MPAYLAKNRTTVVAGSTLPCPAHTTSAPRAPIRRRTGRALLSSSAAVRPLIASTIPPGRTTRTAISASRSSGATARAVATSARSTVSSARPRSTLALARPSSATHSDRNRQRRSIGSSKVTLSSGRIMASTRPGRPAPEPISASVRYRLSMRSATTAQLSRWRSHNRGTSRGPIRPRSTPRVASMRANAWAWSSAGPNTAVAAGGGRTSGAVSPATLSSAKSVSTVIPTGAMLSKSFLFVTGRHRGRIDHHSPVRLLALRLAALPGRGHRVVHDLPLERGHGGQGLRLSGARDILGHGPPVVGELGAAPGPVAADVEHQPGSRAGLPVHGEPGQLLERLQDRAVVADEFVQRRADDRDDRAVPLDVHVDVAVKIRDVQQAFHVVRGDIALELEVAQLGTRGCPVVLAALGCVEGLLRVGDLHVLLAHGRTSHCAQCLQGSGNQVPALAFRRLTGAIGHLNNPHGVTFTALPSPLARPLASRLPHRLLPHHLSGGYVVLGLGLLFRPAQSQQPALFRAVLAGGRAGRGGSRAGRRPGPRRSGRRA